MHMPACVNISTDRKYMCTCVCMLSMALALMNTETQLDSVTANIDVTSWVANSATAHFFYDVFIVVNPVCVCVCICITCV